MARIGLKGEKYQTKNEDKQICSSSETPEIEISFSSEESTETNELAKQISDVLRNPNLPVEIYNAILHGTDEIVNSSSPDANGKYETSAEHIKSILKMCSKE